MGNVKLISVIVPKTQSWMSMKELNEFNLDFLKKRYKNAKVQEFKVGSILDFNKAAVKILDGDLIFFSKISDMPFVGMYTLLRQVLKYKKPIWIYCPAVATSRAKIFDDILGIFSDSDRFVMSSETDIAAFREIHPRLKALLVRPKFRKPVLRGRKTLEIRKKFVYVGRITPAKNIHSLIYSYARYRAFAKNPLPLWIVGPFDLGKSELFGYPGRPRYLQECHRLAKALKIENFVIWKKKVSSTKVCEFCLDPSNIFVSASIQRDESYGVVLHRAVQWGRSAVVSAWGGHLDLKKLAPQRVSGVPVQFGRKLILEISTEVFARELLALSGGEHPHKLSAGDLVPQKQVFRKFRRTCDWDSVGKISKADIPVCRIYGAMSLSRMKSQEFDSVAVFRSE